MHSVEIPCEFCKKNFYITPSRLKKNKHHTCSFTCSGKLSSILHSQKIHKKCEICEKDLFYKKSKVKEINHFTCSVKCRGELIKKIGLYSGKYNPKSRNLTHEEKIFWNRCSAYKSRAKARKWNFDLDYKFLIDLFYKQKGLCHYTGYTMRLEGQKDFDTLSLDRVQSDKGYTKDNVVFVLNCVNMLKSNYDISKVLTLFDKMKRKTMINLKVKKLYPDSKTPTKTNDSDVGLDLYVHHFEDCGTFVKVFTGIAVQPESGYYSELVARSSIYKKGLVLHNCIGIIDRDYTGEIIGVFYKTKDFKGIEVGERLLQLIGREQLFFRTEVVEELSDTSRGAGGFGSTGV